MLALLIVIPSLITTLLAFEPPIYDQPAIAVPTWQSFIIAEPSAMTRVVSKHISQQDGTLLCEPLPAQATPSVLAHYNLSDYDSLEGIRESWSTQIVSATSRNGHNQVWVLLSNGTLLQMNSSSTHRDLLVDCTYHFERPTDFLEASIFCLNSKTLFIQYQGAFYHLELQGQTWRLGARIVQGGLLAVKTSEDGRLYALTP
jgi:hypothetical protein